MPWYYSFSRCPEFPLSPLGIWGGQKSKSHQLKSHKPSLKIMNSFTGICLYSKWHAVISSTATYTDWRTLTRPLVFNSWSSVYGGIPEITHSIELLLNKEENWQSRISFKFLGLQSSHNVSQWVQMSHNVKGNIYRAMLWRRLQKSSN